MARRIRGTPTADWRTWPMSIASSVWADRWPGSALPSATGPGPMTSTPRSGKTASRTGNFRAAGSAWAAPTTRFPSGCSSAASIAGCSPTITRRTRWTKLDDQPVDGQGFAVDTKRKLLVGVGRGRITVYRHRPQQLQAASHQGPRCRGHRQRGQRRRMGLRSGRGPHGGLGIVGARQGLRPRPRHQDVGGQAGGRRAQGRPVARNGVFGRWRYVPSLNAFIAVSDANGNVFFYKHVAGKRIAATNAPE